MNMTYKIALVVSAVALLLAVIVFTGPSEPADTATDLADATDQPEAPPRKSLVTETPKTDTARPSSIKSATEAAPGKTLAQDVRSRIEAADEEVDPTDAATAQADETTEAAAPNPIPLTRTDTDSASEPAAAEAVTVDPPVISREALDEILGSTPTDAPADDSSVVDESVAEVTTAPVASVDGAFAGGAYVVQPGDTFSSIAQQHYGAESKWFDIAQANPTVDPTRLRVGQELKLPAAAALEKPAEPVADAPGSLTSYTIEAGDSLSTIAGKAYGDPTLWRTIYNFNRDKIGDNPNAIQAGMVLKVPPRVTGAQ
jgi:nucleoid-associated protein YgaU